VPLRNSGNRPETAISWGGIEEEESLGSGWPTSTVAARYNERILDDMLRWAMGEEEREEEQGVGNGTRKVRWERRGGW
jgi:hypothetical protein